MKINRAQIIALSALAWDNLVGSLFDIVQDNENLLVTVTNVVVPQARRIYSITADGHWRVIAEDNVLPGLLKQDDGPEEY